MEPAEKKRLEKMRKYEKKAYAQGFNCIAGVDEAGRGPLAGPVVAAACILPKKFTLKGLNDSKKVLPEKRTELFTVLTAHPEIVYGIGIVDHIQIDTINIHQASIEAMLIAIGQLSRVPELLLVDGRELKRASILSWGIIDGDALSLSIAAASIIAKVTRDRMMREFHQQWPEYCFDQHKGYSTTLHLEKLKLNGPCPIHRRSFEPIKSMLPT